MPISPAWPVTLLSNVPPDSRCACASATSTGMLSCFAFAAIYCLIGVIPVDAWALELTGNAGWGAVDGDGASAVGIVGVGPNISRGFCGVNGEGAAVGAPGVVSSSPMIGRGLTVKAFPPILKTG